MGNTTSRERILSKIRSALAQQSVSKPFPEVNQATEDFFATAGSSLAEQYAVALTRRHGRFVYCDNHEHMISQLLMLADNLAWNKISCKDSKLVSLFGESNMQLVSPDYTIEECQAVVSVCERLVARTGSAVYSSAQAAGREFLMAAPILVTVAYRSQLVADWSDAIEAIRKKYNSLLPSMLFSAAGPSSTTAIENELVLGVHGPKEVYTFLVED